MSKLNTKLNRCAYKMVSEAVGLQTIVVQSDTRLPATYRNQYKSLLKRLKKLDRAYKKEAGG